MLWSVTILTAIQGLAAFAQDVVRVYSAEGPEPALREAASAFSTNEAVVVTSGPPTEWIAGAAADADLVCSSAGFMMSDFISNEAMQIDPSSITPLYVRPSAILVRPGNPKRIGDFPDLLKPGMRIMVVTGSGQTGLWEDMAGRTADIQAVHGLRANIACYAPNSTEAVRIWRERKDIDAWITWDTWHMPLRTEAKLIPVSKDYRLFRQCSVALTRRGRGKALAADFVKFLASSDGARIFASWGWTTPAKDDGATVVRHDIRVVWGVDSIPSTNGTALGLLEVNKLVEDYESLGVANHELRISVVLSRDAASAALTDDAYQRLTRAANANPNRALAEKLLGRGISLEVSGQELKERNWTKEDLLEGVVIVPGANERIVDLQLRGYAYIKL